jgi:hypothetical protein
MAEDHIKDHRSGHNGGSDENKCGDDELEGKLEETQSGREGSSDKAPEEDELIDDDPKTEGQIRHSLRLTRKRDYSNQLGHVMDNPVNTKSYDVQLFQDDEGGAPKLREAVQEMQNTGSNADVLKCLTGIIMMQMTAKAGIKKHGQVAIEAHSMIWEFSLHENKGTS